MNVLQNIKKAAKEQVGKRALAEEWLEGCTMQGQRDSAVFKARYAMCQACDPHYTAEQDECGICGCIMNIKAALLYNRNPKTLKIEKTHCPIYKWQ